MIVLVVDAGSTARSWLNASVPFRVAAAPHRRSGIFGHAFQVSTGEKKKYRNALPLPFLLLSSRGEPSFYLDLALATI